MNAAYIVTTSVRGHSRTQVWDPKTPLALGHPFHWIMERTENGVRVRDISGSFHQTQNGGLQQIADELIRGGKAEVKLPNARGDTKETFTLKIRPVQTLPQAYGKSTGNTLTVFACAGHWVLGSEAVTDGEYAATLHKNPVFTAKKSGSEYAVKAVADGLVVDGKAFAKGETLKLDREKLIATTITLGSYSWRFSAVQVPNWVENANKAVDVDNEWFKKSMAGAALGFALFMVLSWLWPKPQEELVPPQLAKIILAPTQKTASKTEKAVEAASANSKMPEKVQKAAVVQAFRAKALQNAVSGLLKGGMTKLLAQSDFVAANTDKAKGIFNAKSQALMGATPDSGVMSQKNVAVNGIGGAGTGKAAGYGKGEHATVAGQGQGFVSMDIGGATATEGLTKDEVGEVIHRHMSEIRYCYESAMIRTPDIEGKLIVNFTIGGNGYVKTSEVKSSTLPDPRLDDCVIRRLNTWKFPNPKGGIDVAVSYPFIFKTLGR